MEQFLSIQILFKWSIKRGFTPKNTSSTSNLQTIASYLILWQMHWSMWIIFTGVWATARRLGKEPCRNSHWCSIWTSIHTGKCQTISPFCPFPHCNHFCDFFTYVYHISLCISQHNSVHFFFYLSLVCFSCWCCILSCVILCCFRLLEYSLPVVYVRT